MKPEIHAEIMEQLAKLIGERIGLDFPQQRWNDLRRGLQAAAGEAGFKDATGYACSLLAAHAGAAQWTTLATHLTIGETYFMRDMDSLEIFSSRILPELIQARRASTRHIRLWSAACCTGEEAYTLAILLRRTLPDWDQWQITLLATDINPLFLHKAREGIYSKWSFRGTPAWLQQYYFKALPGGKFKLAPEIRAMVQFVPLNLAGNDFPSAGNGTEGMDVIFCRNVLMYFSAEQSMRVLRRLYAAQAEGGWLIVSPSETPHVKFPLYTAVTFPKAVMYRRMEHPPARAAAATLPCEPPPVAVAPLPSPTIEAAASTLTGSEEYTEPLLSDFPANASSPAAFECEARALADSGRLPEALVCCDRWLEADKLDAQAHHLRGLVLQELGRAQEAIVAMQNALFINPDFAMAHFALGNIARLRGEPDKADRHFANTQDSLKRVDPAAILSANQKMTADELTQALRILKKAGPGQ